MTHGILRIPHGVFPRGAPPDPLTSRRKRGIFEWGYWEYCIAGEKQCPATAKKRPSICG